MDVFKLRGQDHVPLRTSWTRGLSIETVWHEEGASLRVDLFDLWHGNSRVEKESNALLRFLRQKNEIAIDQVSPEVAICSCLGQRHRQLIKPIVKVQYVGENRRPDLEDCDCCISVDREEDDIRFRLPLYLLYDECYDRMMQSGSPQRKNCHRERTAEVLWSVGLRSVRCRAK